MAFKIFAIILFCVLVFAIIINFIYFSTKKLTLNNKEKNVYIPETLEQCRHNYLPKVDKYISCQYFGDCDGMNGSCIWCREMTPYQWQMCRDESSLKNIMYLHPEYTKEEAISQIQKQKNERRRLL